MKSVLKFTLWLNRDLRPAAFEALGMICREGLNVDRGKISCDMPMDDDRFALILACLAEYGYRPWRGRVDKVPGEVSLRIVRTYDRKDFESAHALELNVLSQIHSGDRRASDGRLLIATEDLASKARLRITGSYGLVASDELKVRLEREGLVGLDFRPVELVGPPRAVATRVGQFWELDSSIVLPPMAPQMRFIHAVSGSEVAGGSPPPFVYREGGEFPAHSVEPAEIHYLAEPWAGVRPFDLARTHERPMGDRGVPIASVRLYRLLSALRIPAAWVPVRID